MQAEKRSLLQKRDTVTVVNDANNALLEYKIAKHLLTHKKFTYFLASLLQCNRFLN